MTLILYCTVCLTEIGVHIAVIINYVKKIVISAITNHLLHIQKRNIGMKEKNKCTARNIHFNSNRKYWFKCNNCPHSFDTAPNTIVSMNNWCPYCCKTGEKSA